MMRIFTRNSVVLATIIWSSVTFAMPITITDTIYFCSGITTGSGLSCGGNYQFSAIFPNATATSDGVLTLTLNGDFDSADEFATYNAIGFLTNQFLLNNVIETVSPNVQFLIGPSDDVGQPYGAQVLTSTQNIAASIITSFAGSTYNTSLGISSAVSNLDFFQNESYATLSLTYDGVPNSVPAPETLALLGLGLAGLGWSRRKKA